MWLAGPNRGAPWGAGGLGHPVGRPSHDVVPPPPFFSSTIGAYKYMDTLRCLDRCTPPARTLPVNIRTIVTPLDWEIWGAKLAKHPDQHFRQYIVSGIRNGFRIGFDYQRPLKSSRRNMPSVSSQPQAIREYLAVECAAGRILGPLQADSVPGLQVNRFGLIPKKTPGEWRLIVDLSSPEGSSVNDGEYDHLCSLKYISVEDALAEIRKLGRGTLLAKVDIQKAYRMVPVHPADRPLLGMQWEGAVYLDAALPFGLRSAPKIFTAVADAAEWVARSEGVPHIMHYLDDFLVLGRPGASECQQSLKTLLEVFQELGVPVAPGKLEGPATCLTFLGIEIDTSLLEVRLPAEKLHSLQVMVESFAARQACTRRELESLLGSLGHACCVVKQGKTFLRRLFELLAVARRAHHYLRLNAAARSDLCWWLAYLAPLNQASFARSLQDYHAQFTFATDASGSVGCGAVWTHSWFQLKWQDLPPGLAEELGRDSITFKELLPVVIAAGVWGPCWGGHSGVVYCDNQGAAAAVNSGYSKVPRIMHLLRCLFLIKARFDLELTAVYLPGELNTTADAISHDNLSFLFAQVPAARSGYIATPPPLLVLLLPHHAQ